MRPSMSKRSNVVTVWRQISSCPKARWQGGDAIEIFINWYYLGEAGIGYMNVCIKLMQTNQYINIDQ